MSSLPLASPHPAAAALRKAPLRKSTAEPLWVRRLLTCIALLFLALFLVLPLIIVFSEAFSRGAELYWASISEPAALHAIKLTLIAAAIAVPCNVIFGLAASWAIAKFQFKGRQLLITLIDLPIAVSPVIVGLSLMLIFGARGYLGDWLMDHDVRIMFAVIFRNLLESFGDFITFPFVARELIPLMQEQGREQEEAALTLGANGWQTFFRVTLPSVKWALLYGVILANARAMGEFGAVSVVSGKIREQTNTMPLHIEILYNEYQFAAAFAVSSLLALLALVTLLLKSLLEYKAAKDLAITGPH